MTTDVVKESALGVIGAATDATRKGIRDETIVPPFADEIDEKMMNDAIAKLGGKDFAIYWLMHNKGDATADLVVAMINIVGEFNDIAKIVLLELLFVHGVTLVFAGLVKRFEEAVLEPLKVGDFGVRWDGRNLRVFEMLRTLFFCPLIFVFDHFCR